MSRLATKLLGEVGDVFGRIRNTFRPRIAGALRVAQGTRGIAKRTLAPVGSYIRYLRRTVAAVENIDGMNDCFPGTGVVININIGRASAVRGKETFKQQRPGKRLRISTAEYNAHHGTRRRATTMAQYTAAGTNIHDTADNPEIAGKAYLFGDPQLMLNL